MRLACCRFERVNKACHAAAAADAFWKTLVCTKFGWLASPQVFKTTDMVSMSLIQRASAPHAEPHLVLPGQQACVGKRLAAGQPLIIGRGD